MQLLSDTLETFVLLALAVSVVQLYLSVNKIWLRKHEPVVAESVSVAAHILALVTGLPFFLKYVLLEKDPTSAIDTGMWLGLDVLLIFIGAGFWVGAHGERRFLTGLARALRLERDEAAALARRLIRPHRPGEMIALLFEIGQLDGGLSPQQETFIRSLARSWGVPDREVQAPPPTPLTAVDLPRLTTRMSAYLSASPAAAHLRQLEDVMGLLVRMDGHVNEDEELILSELLGLIRERTGDGRAGRNEVLVVPQQPDHGERIRLRWPGARRGRYLGGEAFRVGYFYSDAYAELMAERYRREGYFTIVYLRPEGAPEPSEEQTLRHTRPMRKGERFD